MPESWLQPTQRTERRVCPFCKSEEELTVMEPDAGAPLAVKHEVIFYCAKCQRLSIPAGVLKRVGGLALLLPFLLFTFGALGTAGWMLWVVLSAGELEPGYLLISAILGGLGVFAGRITLRTVFRLLEPGSLLPLGRTHQGDHRFDGEL